MEILDILREIEKINRTGMIITYSRYGNETTISLYIDVIRNNRQCRDVYQLGFCGNNVTVQKQSLFDFDINQGKYMSSGRIEYLTIDSAKGKKKFIDTILNLAGDSGIIKNRIDHRNGFTAYLK